MRVHHLAMVTVGALLSACSTRFEGAPVYGASHAVSGDDLHAAAVAVAPFLPRHKPAAFRVISADEIWLYQTSEAHSDYRIARRAKGKWQESGGVLVLVEPVQ